MCAVDGLRAFHIDQLETHIATHTHTHLQASALRSHEYWISHSYSIALSYYQSARVNKSTFYMPRWISRAIPTSLPRANFN